MEYPSINQAVLEYHGPPYANIGQCYSDCAYLSAVSPGNASNKPKCQFDCTQRTYPRKSQPAPPAPPAPPVPVDCERDCPCFVTPQEESRTIWTDLTNLCQDIVEWISDHPIAQGIILLALTLLFAALLYAIWKRYAESAKARKMRSIGVQACTEGSVEDQIEIVVSKC